MNFTESFDQFTSRLGPMDLALYAGIGMVLWILFKDKLNPVKTIVSDWIGKTNNTIASAVSTQTISDQEDIFFKLVSSWKQTRDLAIKSGCEEAVKVADQMFPYLSPTGCKEKKL